MTSFDRFERSLPVLLDDLASPRLPDYADDLFARTAATRQRPGWTFPERWIFMSALTRRFAAVPRIPWRLGVTVAILALVAVLVAVTVGALQDRAPAPFGPAGNGQIVMLDQQGRILIADAAGQASRVLIDTSGNLQPTFSSDGSRIAYLTPATEPLFDVFVAPVDGGAPVKLTLEPISTPAYVGWSPTGDELLVVDGGGRALLLDSARPAAPTVIGANLGLGGLEVGAGYNFRSSAAFRPPDGGELLFVANGGGSLVALPLGGSGFRTLIDRSNPAVAISSIGGAQWSPDGTQVLVMLDIVDTAQRKQPYVLNADGSGLRAISDALDNPLIDVNSPSWSPDGTRIALQYWTTHADDEGQDFHPIAVVDLATGKLTDVGPLLVNGATWGWSPDGASILELPGDQPGVMLVIDATTGEYDTLKVNAYENVDWQRVKP